MKIVDKRWYEKNKHIYPASTWQNVKIILQVIAELIHFLHLIVGSDQVFMRQMPI